MIRLPLQGYGVGRAPRQRHDRLDEGGVGREGAGEAATLLPGHQRAGPVGSAADEDPDVLVDAGIGRPEIGIAAQDVFVAVVGARVSFRLVPSIGVQSLPVLFALAYCELVAASWIPLPAGKTRSVSRVGEKLGAGPSPAAARMVPVVAWLVFHWSLMV